MRGDESRGVAFKIKNKCYCDLQRCPFVKVTLAALALLLALEKKKTKKGKTSQIRLKAFDAILRFFRRIYFEVRSKTVMETLFRSYTSADET